VVLITGWGDQIDPAQLTGSGVDLMVAKPYKLPDLLRALAQARVFAQGGGLATT
jgi:hypothetical protein